MFNAFIVDALLTLLYWFSDHADDNIATISVTRHDYVQYQAAVDPEFEQIAEAFFTEFKILGINQGNSHLDYGDLQA